MAQSIRDVMTANPVCCQASATVAEAAQAMKESDIGDVLVMDGDTLVGVVTDRDIVVRALADGRDASSTKLGDICSRDVVTLTPDASVDEAMALMSDRAVRRIPICEGNRPVGMVSLGDLSFERDTDRALAEISAAPPND